MNAELSNSHFDRFVMRVFVPGTGVREKPAYDLPHTNFGTGMFLQKRDGPVDVQRAIFARDVRERQRTDPNFVRDMENRMF